MKAVILAAGMASRLRPLTDDRPKCLLKVGKRCLLQRTMDALIAAGIRSFVVVTGYRGNMIREFLASTYNETGIDVNFIDNIDYQNTNNIYSLWLAAQHVRGGEFLLLDSDILFDPRIIVRLLAGSTSTLALNSHELGDEEIKVVPDADGMVAEISKVCSISDAIGESVGIERMDADYSAALFDELDVMIEGEGLKNVFYERAFERLIAKGHRFGITDTTDLFSIELDTVDDFERAKELIPDYLY
ncbi:MAG: sugar phosphate nucleotidyltransferase [Prevotella sp.]